MFFLRSLGLPSVQNVLLFSVFSLFSRSHSCSIFPVLSGVEQLRFDHVLQFAQAFLPLGGCDDSLNVKEVGQ